MAFARHCPLPMQQASLRLRAWRKALAWIFHVERICDQPTGWSGEPDVTQLPFVSRLEAKRRHPSTTPKFRENLKCIE